MMAIYLMTWEAQPNSVSPVRHVSSLLADLQLSTILAFSLSVKSVGGPFHRVKYNSLVCLYITKIP